MSSKALQRLLLTPVLPVVTVGSPAGQQQQQLHHLGTCEKCTFSGPAPDLLSQNLWGGAQLSVWVLTHRLGDGSTHCPVLVHLSQMPGTLRGDRVQWGRANPFLHLSS